MYSLYRAWLLRESSPPDVILSVGSGSHQFSGHRNVLSAQSGYLKSLLSEPQQTETPHTRIMVPNVSPEVFAPLLTFMYTGYLDLTPDNIYGVLLATHLLHMPRALDLCRSYLLQQQQAAQLPPPLVKPIPSRKMLPLLLPPPPPPPGVYWPPPPYQPLPPLSEDATHYRSVFPLALSRPEAESKGTSPSPPAVPSTSNGPPHESPPAPRSSISPCPSQASDSSDQVTVTVTHRPKRPGNQPDGKKAVVDVACCDGPVRFHRVLNRNYGVDLQETAKSSTENKNSTLPSSTVTKSKPEESSTTAESTTTSGDTSPVFTCHYCNHTFKSHYCYQKHARRHINPVNLEIRTRADHPISQPSTEKHPTPVPGPGPGTGSSQQPSNGGGQKRQVRLLDMNVQYYPCKTCGSKFPSYYFVHKHRKMCHPGEDSAPQSQEPANNDEQ